ncbi:unnamed protein product [Meloidogyne enterolobii]|uniref:Uncharacterized protein n=1 Tax=Meloidogyne enterolobii TaxID=390850 RepID=A0ACB0Z5C0_MELEN
MGKELIADYDTDTDFVIRIRIFTADTDGYPQAFLQYLIHIRIYVLVWLIVEKMHFCRMSFAEIWIVSWTFTH